MKGVMPFAQLDTALPILTVTVCFGAQITRQEWNDIGFEIRPEYRINFYKKDNRAIPTIEEVIRTIRNATAHLPDFIAREGRYFQTSLSTLGSL